MDISKLFCKSFNRVVGLHYGSEITRFSYSLWQSNKLAL